MFSPEAAGSTAKRRDCKWLRPGQISQRPTFISSGISRFDVIQGELGDCWLIAATANLSLNQRLFSRVVPTDQSFEPGQYCGIFHFRFWQFGNWVDVVIDDRLPTIDDKLLFVRSSDENEFWSSLLEKAYAKLHGSYEALRGGTTCEAMVDFTGGLTEFFEVQSAECPPNLFNIMLKAFERQSLIGCSIEAQDESQRENELPNGLIKGHAYSITSVINLPYEGRHIPMIRLRNPWSGTSEWNGAWSDGSSEWHGIRDYEKSRLGLTFEADGEFWISFHDFKRNFTRVEVCNLGPDAYDDDKQRQWHVQMFEGSWVAGVSAGGCRNNLNTFHLNPQYIFTLVDHDEGDGESLCTCIVALMQKHRRSKYKMGSDQLTIGFAIYELKEGNYQKEPVGYSAPQFRRQLLTLDFFKYNCSVARSPTYINLREISARFRLSPGTYCIIPSTFDKNEEGNFILRVWTETPTHNAHENDVDPALYPTPDPVVPPQPAPTPALPVQPSYPTYPTPVEPKPSYPSYPTPPAPSYPSYPSYPSQPSQPGLPGYPQLPTDGNGFHYPTLPQEPVIKPAVAPEPPPGPRYPDINISEVISTIQTVINVLTMCWTTFQKMQASTSPSGYPNSRGGVFNENISYSTGYRTHAERKDPDEFFRKIAGDDMEVDAHDLHKVLNTALKKEFNFEAFTLETCRSLIALLDEDHSGSLELIEFNKLWKDIRPWCNIFLKHDINKDHCIDASELRESLREAGIQANRVLLTDLVRRYGNVEKITHGKLQVPKIVRSLSFDAFVHCCVKLKTIISYWEAQRKKSRVGGDMHHARSTEKGKIRMIDSEDDLDGTETAPFTLDEFVTRVMYS